MEAVGILYIKNLTTNIKGKEVVKLLIQEQTIEMKWWVTNREHYESLGYTFTKYKDKFEVNVKDLMPQSDAKVDVLCDYCGKMLHKTYKNYIKQHDDIMGDCCPQCKTIKCRKTNMERRGVPYVMQDKSVIEKSKATCREKYGVETYSQTSECIDKIKETNLKKYGVECVFQSEDVKLKIKETNLKKYGKEYISQVEEIREKVKETNLEKYGYINPLQNEEIQRKSRDTCLEKYGKEYPMQVAEIQEKSRNTCLEKYGVEHPLQVEEFQEKSRNTCLKKYGREYPMQVEECQEKSKETLLEKYGVEHPMYVEEFREKVRNTCLEKYGVDSPLKSPYIRAKASETLCKNGTVRTSKQQIVIFDLLKEIYPNCECILNYPLSRLNLDCMINIDGVKIDVEYDGWYWHKNNQEYDRRRNYFVITNGYKVLRIKSNYKLPTKEQLINAIDYLVKGNHSYAEITLDI